jgi:PleD family two-component response regulator
VRAAVAALTFPATALDRVTISVGAAMHHSGQPVDEAIGDADRALYQAKNSGRDRVCANWQ